MIDKLFSLSKIYSITTIDEMIQELSNELSMNTPNILPKLDKLQIEEIYKTYFETMYLLLENIIKPHVKYYEIYYKKIKYIEDFLSVYNTPFIMFIIRIMNEKNKNQIFLMSENLEYVIDTKNKISSFLDNIVFDRMENFNSWRDKPDPLFEKYYNKDFYSNMKKIEEEAKEELKKLLNTDEHSVDDSVIDDILGNKMITPHSFKYYDNINEKFKYCDYKDEKINEIIKQKNLKAEQLFSERFSDLDKDKKSFLENPKTNLVDVFTFLKYTFNLDVSLFEFFTENNDNGG